MTEDKEVKFMFSYRASQKVWMKIALSFLLFYVGEALLFWQGGMEWGAPVLKLPFSNPFIYPLGFWGLFGFSIYLLLKRNSSSEKNSALTRRFLKWQGVILTAGITVGVIGVAWVVMKRTGDIPLGHTALFFAIFLIAIVFGGIELNIGWLSAGLLWFATAILIYNYPADLDIIPRYNDADVWIGLSTTIGFFLIGALPYYVNYPAEAEVLS